jgi:hypothetical protein
VCVRLSLRLFHLFVSPLVSGESPLVSGDRRLIWFDRE